MFKLLSQFTYSVIFKLLGKERTLALIRKYLRYSNTSFSQFSYEANGIHKYENLERSGEKYLVTEKLSAMFREAGIQHPVLIDVGANMGDYSRLLLENFPAASIHVFEPNIHCFESLLKTRLQGSIKFNNMGLSSIEKATDFYISRSNANTELASLDKTVFEMVHEDDDVEVIPVQLTTLDNYCRENHIEQINFIKIDTEGHELEVLKGAAGMIQADRIKIIQFEFNEMNIYSRIFLKDFYDILPGYHFYRLDTDRLIALHSYHPSNEIFQFQNILAIHPTLHAV